MFTEDGPYGSLPEFDRELQWSYSCEGNTTKSRGSEVFEPLNGKTSPVREVTKLRHTIRTEQIEDEEYEGIDIEEDADYISDRSNTMLIKPQISKLRERAATNNLDPDNVVDIEPEEIEATLQGINDLAVEYQDVLLRGAASRLMAFDMACGQTEAIIRDCFETDISIDDELVPYIEAISNADVIAATLKQCKNMPQTVWEQALKDYLTSSLASIREDQRLEARNEAKSRRFRSEYEEMIARVGKSRTRQAGQHRDSE